MIGQYKNTSHFPFPPQLHGLNVLRWKSPLLSSMLHWHMRSTGHFRSGASSEEGRAASLSLAHLIAKLRSQAKVKKLCERSPLRKTKVIDKLGLGRSRGRFGLALRRYTLSSKSVSKHWEALFCCLAMFESRQALDES